jgi:hypothetical protein
MHFEWTRYMVIIIIITGRKAAKSIQDHLSHYKYQGPPENAKYQLYWNEKYQNV